MSQTHRGSYAPKIAAVELPDAIRTLVHRIARLEAKEDVPAWRERRRLRYLVERYDEYAYHTALLASSASQRSADRGALHRRHALEG